MTRPRLSLIVPAFNEEALLPGLLDSFETARARVPWGRDLIELLVADNASTDRTAEIARDRGARVVRVEKRCIAAARNGGARASKGEWLAFVDADSVLHPDTFLAIDETIARGDVVAGATGARPSRSSSAIRLLEGAVALVRLAGLDSGVVFCRREDWEAVGGYDERFLVAEDLRFLMALKRHGRTAGRRFRRARGAPVITSTRKFDRHGDWSFLATLAVRAPLLYVFRRGRFHELTRRYWYDDRSGPA